MSAVDPSATTGAAELLGRLKAEIDEEVRRRRAAGDFPPSLERRLDRLFARFVPEGAGEDDFAEVLRLADRSAFIDIEVPVRSQRRGVSQVKRVLRMLMAWYLNYVVQQLTHFTAATTRVLHMLDRRVSALEAESLARKPPALPGDGTAEVDLGAWAGVVEERLRGVVGRVLHAECGRGELLRLLIAAGLDAYGVDPRAELLDDAVLSGLEVVFDDVLPHLRAVGDGGLGGLVLSGCVDRLGLPDQRELATLAAKKLAPGGVLVVIGTAPEAWARDGDPARLVEADLAPGRPLHAETWAHLFGLEGLAVETRPGPSAGALEPVPGDDPATALLNANLRRIEARLFGPQSYAVIAEKRRCGPGERDGRGEPGGGA